MIKPRQRTVIHFDVLVDSTRCVAIEGKHQDGTADFLSCSMIENEPHRIEPHPNKKEAVDRAIALAVELLGDQQTPSVREYLARRHQ